MKNPRNQSNNDLIKVNEYIIVNLKMKNTTEHSKLFCDKIEYIHNKEKNMFDHHLMFYLKDSLIFKIWLPNEAQDKEFSEINEALESVGMQTYLLESDRRKIKK